MAKQQPIQFSHVFRNTWLPENGSLVVHSRPETFRSSGHKTAWEFKMAWGTSSVTSDGSRLQRISTPANK